MLTPKFGPQWRYRFGPIVRRNQMKKAQFGNHRRRIQKEAKAETESKSAVMTSSRIGNRQKWRKDRLGVCNSDSNKRGKLRVQVICKRHVLALVYFSFYFSNSCPIRTHV